jgi:sporulation integral membrane protein YlbJ
MYQSPNLGLVLAGAHYGANLTIGLLMGVFSNLRMKGWAAPVRADYSQPLKQILRRAFRELGLVHRDNYQPLGWRLSTAISKSINTLLMIGGFIITFSVLIEVFSKLGLLGHFAHLLAIILTNLGLDSQLAPALATGIFEITLGTKLAAETAAPLPEKMLVTSFLLAWSGISVHAQVAGIISGTDLRYWPFFLCRLAHALLAAGYSLLLYKPINALLETATIPVWGSLTTKFGGVLPWWYQFKLFSWLFIWDCGLLGLVALLLLTLKQLKLPRNLFW